MTLLFQRVKPVLNRIKHIRSLLTASKAARLLTKNNNKRPDYTLLDLNQSNQNLPLHFNAMHPLMSVACIQAGDVSATIILLLRSCAYIADGCCLCWLTPQYLGAASIDTTSLASVSLNT